ncbi:phenylalanine--tRNA ligase subunit beta [Demequina oxidasica]|uniref:phenylalanine--tRNA ligase subunit beta n=1 Tax=Demequina oxidasica TaxID=676199 RepID=UPI000780AC10|nr:phenylalanine--tRNA ligase subunit beta [Demequina oxidasica]
MPKVPLSWLAESVDLVDGSSAEDVAAALARVGLEEEGIEGPPVKGPLVVGRVLSLVKETASNGKTVNYCRVDVGGHNDEPITEGYDNVGQVEGKGPDAGHFFTPSRGIVCGAHNFVEGDYVVVVLPGAELPGPFPISGRKTYGHWSDGMICSAKELGLGEDHDGIIVLQSPTRDADAEFGGFALAHLEPGQDAIELLGLDENTIEINVTPDRGYSFSIRGVAREYAHATGQEFRDPAAIETPAKTFGGFSVEIDDPEPVRGNVGADRFVARIVRGFDPTAASPTWMKSRLTASGMRPISLAVDVTNYVMLELGQPLHAYDLAKLTAPIVVRRASASGDLPAISTLTTLDDSERNLDGEDLLICDSEGGRGARAIGIAGVMGGADTEVSDSTTDILLEGAHFDPITIARSARRHKLGSEASRRFERGVDTQLAPVAVQRAIDLLTKFGGGEVDTQVTDVNDTVAPTPIEMRVDFPGSIVGVEYTRAGVIGALEQVGCTVKLFEALSEPDSLTVTPPTWRPDLTDAINLVEEVARLHGFENLPSVLPTPPPGRGYTHSQKVRKSVARGLADRGLTQVLTYPFISEQRLDDMLIPDGDPRREVVRLANPLSAELPLMRTSLIQSLVDALKVNLGRGAQDVAIYEVGRAYRASNIGQVARTFSGDAITPDDVEALNDSLPMQPRRVGGLMTGQRTPSGWHGAGAPFDWTDALAAAQAVAQMAGVTIVASAEAHMPWHPGRCATYRLVDGTFVGHAGELHPKVLETLGLPSRTVAFEMILDPMVEFREGQITLADAVNAQPLAKEDFAFVVASDVAAGDLVACVRRAGGDLVEDARVFDVYVGEQVGEGKKSLAVAVRMRAEDKTLSAEDVLEVRKAIIAAAESEFEAVLR